MDFSGWEKLSLVDYDDYITTTLFASGCNFRCPFCHNGPLVLSPKDNPTIPWENVIAYLTKRKGTLDAVCISGGEPTLVDDLESKLRQIKSLGYKIKLDTNGTRPDLIKCFFDQGLVDHFAIDIKNSKARYAETIGLKQIDLTSIEETVRFLLASDCSYEFRTTLIEEFHDENSIAEIGEWIAGAKRYYLQRYIDSPNCIEHGFHMVSKEKAEKYAKSLQNIVKTVELRGYD